MKSIDPSMPTRATVCRSPMIPWFSIGWWLMRRSARVMVFENFSPSPHQTPNPDEATRKRDDLGIAGHNGSVLEARRRHGQGVSVGDRMRGLHAPGLEHQGFPHGDHLEGGGAEAREVLVGCGLARDLDEAVIDLAQVHQIEQKPEVAGASPLEGPRTRWRPFAPTPH